MMARCVWSTPELGDYHLYNGKGISVCEPWLELSNDLNLIAQRFKGDVKLTLVVRTPSLEDLLPQPGSEGLLYLQKRVYSLVEVSKEPKKAALQELPQQIHMADTYVKSLESDQRPYGYG